MVVAAGRAGGLGDRAHHRDVAAAGDQVPTALADLGADSGGECQVNGRSTGPDAQ